MTLALHTGVPGSGKSLSVVDAIEHESIYKERPVYAHAVDGWTRAVQICCRNPGCRTCRVLTDQQRSSMHCIDDWYEWVPTGSLIVVDEAHYPFPSRREKEQPMSVQRLTEHRHDGIDIWLCTPNSNMLDINVRRLVEQHKHFVKGRMGRYVYTHSECMASDEQLKSVKKERFSLPKRSYKFYKSADAHVTIKAEKPKILYRIPLFICAALALVYFAVHQANNLRRSNAPTPVPVEVSTNNGPVADAGGSGGFLQDYSGLSSRQSFSSADVVQDWSLYNREGFSPRVALFPESAPVYDVLEVAPVSVPAFVGCVARTSSGDSECRCYDSQAGVLEVPEAACRFVAAGGTREEWMRGGGLRKRSVQATPLRGSL